MEKYILLGAQEDTLFFIHLKDNKSDSGLVNYNIYSAALEFGLIKSLNYLVNIFEISDQHEMDMVSIQHNERGSVDQFLLDNLTEIFNNLCIITDNLKTLVIYYNHENDQYSLIQEELNISNYGNKKIKNVDYIILGKNVQ